MSVGICSEIIFIEDKCPRFLGDSITAADELLVTAEALNEVPGRSCRRRVSVFVWGGGGSAIRVMVE